MLCDNLEGWDEVGGESEFQERGNICMLTAVSHCCITETNTTL